jgi:hypothetical protein
MISPASWVTSLWLCTSQLRVHACKPAELAPTSKDCVGAENNTGAAVLVQPAGASL